MKNQLPKQPQKTRQIPLRLLLIIPFVLQIVGAVGLVGYLSSVILSLIDLGFSSDV